MNLSPNFTLEQLTRSNTANQLRINNAPCGVALNQLSSLCNNVLEKILKEWTSGGNKPFNISSGYRSPKLNKAVGGAKTSQHMSGEAADISMGSKTSNAKLYKLIDKMITEGKITVGQLINEYGYQWVHVSLGTKNQRLKIGN